VWDRVFSCVQVYRERLSETLLTGNVSGKDNRVTGSLDASTHRKPNDHISLTRESLLSVSLLLLTALAWGAVYRGSVTSPQPEREKDMPES